MQHNNAPKLNPEQVAEYKANYLALYQKLVKNFVPKNGYHKLVRKKTLVTRTFVALQ